MTTFHNPYHFVPIHEDPSPDDPLRRQGGPTAEDFRKDGLEKHTGRLAHDRYEGLSGRLLVKLETETPLVIGATQNRPTDESYAEVEPYLFKNEPAIPATSLKGMLATLIEAASHSAMRVMADTRPVSWRQPMQRALSALGLIERDEATGKLRLRPLTVPNGKLRNGGRRISFAAKHEFWCRVFARYGNFKVHIGNYPAVPKRDRGGAVVLDRRGRPVQLRVYPEGAFAYELRIKPPALEPIARCTPYYLRAWHGGALQDAQAPSPPDCHLFEKNGLILGQKGQPATRPSILGEAELIRRRGQGEDTSTYVRGYIRILGGDERADMPFNKYHELFIPCPTDIETRIDALPIPDHVIEAFDQLADERTADQAERAKKKGETLTLRQRLPYLPFGKPDEERADRKRKEGSEEKIWARLRPGQIVYFDVADTPAHGLHVSAISFSAIWRGLATRDNAPASLRDFVQNPEPAP